ncbi:MAG: TlpA family protein disulfide reductase [Thermoflexales bacterium]|nr:TlpA family protein disulfide reductase [Thermoflexales bacterium]MDW8352510.1 TlpA disulfide reductase family protein [Anaerolineae bacterium]
MDSNKRPFPISLIVLSAVAALVGIGLAVLILSSSAAQQAGLPVLVSSSSSSRSLLREGAPAPEFTLKTLDGRPVALADLRGKTTLINFWASWCPPCLEETPALIAAYEELKQANPNIEFIGIGTNDDSANLKRFAENNRIPYIIVEDPDGKVSDAYGVLGMPTTVFVDERGIVRRIWNGAIRKEQVIQIMRAIGG